jgi:phosphatidylglycerol lysyltransferase
MTGPSAGGLVSTGLVGVAEPTMPVHRGHVRAVGAVRRYLRAHPFSSAVAALIFVLALFTGPMNGPDFLVQERVGTGLKALTVHGHWWSPVSSIFFTNNLAELIVVLVSAVTLLGASERLMGWRRTALSFFVTAILGAVVGVGFEVLGNQGGELWSRTVADYISLDPLTGIGGAIMVASAFATALWRRRIRVLVVVVALVFVLYSGQPADVYRLIAVLVGLVLGMLIGPSATKRIWVRSSHHEVRVLSATVVAITAVGPAIALLSLSRFGPLAPIGLLFTNQIPSAANVLDRCQVFAVTQGCVRDMTLERINGVGPVLVSVLPLLLLIVAAYGLLRGSRFGLWLAVSVNGLLAVLAAVYFGFLPVASPDNDKPRPVAHDWEIALALSLSVLLPLSIAIMLTVLRRHFPVLASRRRVRRYLFTVVITGVALALLYVLVGLLLRETAFTRPVDVQDLLADVTERFIPVNFLSRETASFLPTSYVGRLMYHGVGPVFWIVVVLASIRPMRDSRSGARSSDVARARELLVAGGGDALAFITTWPGNRYWFDDLEDAAVAYRVIGRVAITTGGPFGAAGPCDQIIERFARFCDDNGWIPVFYSVEASFSGAFGAMGWETMVVAEQSMIRPQEWSTVGKKWQDVRTSVNRAERMGIRAEWCSYAELSLGATSQIAEISEEWVAEKDLPEMGFTLGGLDELADPAVRLMVAVDPTGRIEGITSWMPCYRSGVIVGWTLDFMRRRSDSVNGVMEFLIAASAVRMREHGIEFMSLSAAPLAHTPGPDDTVAGRDSVLDYLSAALEPVYGFQSLLRFKRKFQPEFRPLIMAYPDPVALPLIGVALARAYLPGISVTQAARLVRSRS